MSIRAKLTTYTRPLSAEELAQVFGKDAHTIRSLARKGTIPSFRLGTSILFEPKAMCDWFDSQ